VADISYAIAIDLTPAPAPVVDAIESIDVERHSGMADILRMRLGVSLSDDGERWLIADEGMFNRLTNVRLTVAFGAGVPAPVFDGHVVETELELSEDPGASSLTVVALDPSALMNLEERAREWPDVPDSVIATTIFTEHGLVPVVDPTQPVRTRLDTTVIQRDTDIRFLRHLAHRNGFDLYVKPTPVPGLLEGHFHLPLVDQKPQGVLSVNLGESTNVTSFRVRQELVRPSAATIGGVDAKTVQAQTATVNTTQHTELGRSTLLGGDKPRSTSLRALGLNQSGEIQTFAQASVDRSTWAVSVEGELDAVLFGQVLEAGQPILVRGAGAEHSGTYLVERVQHMIEGERYRQHFTLRRNAVAPLGTELYLTDTALPL
jgi:hypothetical protein